MSWIEAIPFIYALAIGVDWLAAWVSGRHLFGLGDSWANIGSYAGYVIINGWNGLLTYSCYVAVHEYAIFDLSFIDAGAASQRFWLLGLLLFVLDDLTYYVWRRVSHQNPILWASHVTDHSSQHFNLIVAIRSTRTSEGS